MEPRVMDRPEKTEPKVTLEQLIHLKRAEKPSADFWEGFERDFHRRQLAAVVTAEPLLRRMWRSFGLAARRLAPASAALTALAVVVVAVLRSNTQESASATVSADAAAADLENKVITLPEETIVVSTSPARRAGLATERTPFQGQVRSAPQELAGGSAAARRFVAVAAPVTLASESDGSAIYSAKALTAGAVFRSLASATPESL